jgi:hypothetical protein
MFSKPNALVYVHYNGLVVVKKHAPQAKLKFPPELVANLEVTDAGNFLNLCQQFFADNGLRHKRVLMVLGYNAVFEKKIALDKAGRPNALTDAFVAAIPLEPGQRACLSLHSENQLHLFATNAGLYQPIAAALRASDAAKITAITPVAAYNFTGKERTMDVLAEHFLKDTTVRKKANFATIDPL